MFNNQVGWISHVVVADLMSSSWKQGTEILRDEVIIHLIQHDQLCIVLLSLSVGHPSSCSNFSWLVFT